MPRSRDSREGTPVTERVAQRLRLVDADGAVAPRRAVSVLYVEDDREDVYLLRRQLKALPSFDVQFSHAATVADARAMTAARRFDVVLCDFWLGHETTIAFIDDLKIAADPSPVVLVSSLDNEDIELIGRRAGAAGFVAKADLSAAAIDRIFATLLPDEVAVDHPSTEEQPAGGAAGWLRALIRGLDAFQAAGAGRRGNARPSAFETVMDDIMPAADDLRADLRRTLAGIERSAAAGMPAVSRFDAVPHLADAVARAELQRGDDICFVQPAVPLMIEACPALFPDLLQGFFAEASDALGAPLAIEPSIQHGRLVVEIVAGPPPCGDRRGRALRGHARAAVDARRLVVETLAVTLGGRFVVPDVPAGGGTLARLEIPLRPVA
jgi:CheY-like chemotaxis protein